MSAETEKRVRIVVAGIAAMLDLAVKEGVHHGEVMGEAIARLGGTLVQWGASPDAVRRVLEDGIAKGMGIKH
mgnify:CR=1 FL=1